MIHKNRWSGGQKLGSDTESVYVLPGQFTDSIFEKKNRKQKYRKIPFYNNFIIFCFLTFQQYGIVTELSTKCE